MTFWTILFGLQSDPCYLNFSYLYYCTWKARGNTARTLSEWPPHKWQRFWGSKSDYFLKHSRQLKIYHIEMCFPITSPICWPPDRKLCGSRCLSVSVKGAFFKSQRHMLFTLVEELNFIKAYCYLLHWDLEPAWQSQQLLANDQWESKSDRTSVYYISE